MQLNIWAAGVLACPGAALRASGARRSLEAGRRSRDRPAPCSWGQDHRRRAWDPAGRARREAEFPGRQHGPYPGQARPPPSERETATLPPGAGLMREGLAGKDRGVARRTMEEDEKGREEEEGERKGGRSEERRKE